MSANDKTILQLLIAQRKVVQDPQASDSEFWEFFTAEKILRDFQLDPEEIQSGIVGQESNDGQGGSDGGIDSMFLFVNSKLISDLQQAKDLSELTGPVRFEIIIIQAKSNSGFGLEVLNRLSNTGESIFQISTALSDFAEKYNEPLLDVIERFRVAHEALLQKRPQICVKFVYRHETRFYEYPRDSKSERLGIGKKDSSNAFDNF
jgi:hypothetical protein